MGTATFEASSADNLHGMIATICGKDATSKTVRAILIAAGSTVAVGCDATLIATTVRISDIAAVVSGNFFEHGRHFRFRRFFNGELVFLNAWDDCTAWAWINVAPGEWAWRPVDVCIG